MKPVDGIMDYKTKVMAYGGILHVSSLEEELSAVAEFARSVNRGIDKRLDEKH